MLLELADGTCVVQRKHLVYYSIGKASIWYCAMIEVLLLGQLETWTQATNSTTALTGPQQTVAYKNRDGGLQAFHPLFVTSLHG